MKIDPNGPACHGCDLPVVRKQGNQWLCAELNKEESGEV